MSSFPVVVITQWVGGLGNNLVQLYHAIYLGLKLLKAGVRYPQHPLLLGCELPLRLSAYRPGDVKGEFFQLDEVEQLLQSRLPLQPSKRSVFRNYILPLLNVSTSSDVSHLVTFRYINHLVVPTPSSLPCLQPLQDTLVIHIRSGDVTNGINSHPNYVQPPLAFYQKVIQCCLQQQPLPLADIDADRVQVRHVMVLAQDWSNPTIRALKDWMPAVVTHVGRTLQEDASVLLRAQHLCYGKSWLPVTLALASSNIRSIHLLDGMHNADFVPDDRAHGCRVYHYRLTQEYLKVGNWKNTPSQRQRMLSYPLQAVQLVEKEPE